MKITLLIIILLGVLKGFAQASDFISVVKRNGIVVKSFFPGVPIVFETFDKRQSRGLITSIRNDSIFVREVVDRPTLDGFGIPVIDQSVAYINGFHYKEIDHVQFRERQPFFPALMSKVLIIGGVGYIALNLINGAYLHQSITSHKNLVSLGIATSAIGIGMITSLALRHHNHYMIRYIHMSLQNH